jgi:hypothetical protein
MDPPQRQSSYTIESMVIHEDVFSLLCMLRARDPEKRLDAAFALTKMARDSSDLRDEMCRQGGVISLLTAIETMNQGAELNIVLTLALAYILPSRCLSFSDMPSNMKIIECLQFLFSAARPVLVKNEHISEEECRNIAATGLEIFWFNAVQPLFLDSEEINDTDNHSVNKSYHQLLEMTISLTVQIARYDNSANGNGSDVLHSLRYSLVEHMCYVDVARAMAVREGILPVLVDWLRTDVEDDFDARRCSASALRQLTLIQDNPHLSGWIQSQIVAEGALKELIEWILRDPNVVHRDQLAVAGIISTMCTTPHTRAAVAVEANCVSCLIPVLCDHDVDPSSADRAILAGEALLQLAADAVKRPTVLLRGLGSVIDVDTSADRLME